MMTNAPLSQAAERKPDGARDLQARLYRDIGISAVAAALHSIKQPEPGKPAAVVRELPPGLRDHLAA